MLTDKTNRYMKLEGYKRKIVENLKKTKIEINTSKVRAKRNLLIKNLDDLELELSKSEFLSMKGRIESYAVLALRLLIKDYTKMTDSRYPSILIVPIKCFISRFSECNYLIIDFCKKDIYWIDRKVYSNKEFNI